MILKPFYNTWSTFPCAGYPAPAPHRLSAALCSGSVCSKLWESLTGSGIRAFTQGTRCRVPGAIAERRHKPLVAVLWVTLSLSSHKLTQALKIHGPCRCPFSAAAIPLSPPRPPMSVNAPALRSCLAESTDNHSTVQTNIKDSSLILSLDTDGWNQKLKGYSEYLRPVLAASSCPRHHLTIAACTYAIGTSQNPTTHSSGLLLNSFISPLSSLIVRSWPLKADFTFRNLS